MRWLVVILSVFFAARAASSATAAPADPKKLPATAARALPDTALVEIDGRKMTKAQFIAEMEGLRRRMSALKPPSSNAAAPPDFSAARMKLLEQEKSRIAAKSARAVSALPGGRSPGGGPTPTPDVCMQPKITAMSGAPPLEPGEQIILNGCGFGLADPASQLRLVGNFPGGFLKLLILQWHGNAIQAVVSPVSGVRDQQSTKLQVVRKDLLISNEWPAAFYATRDVTKLPPASVKHTCSTNGNFIHGCEPNEHTFRASHWDNQWADTVKHSGTDTVSGHLKNGCVYAGIGWAWGGENGTLTADPTANLVTGNANISMKFPWVIWASGDLNRSVYYMVDLYALGPVGMPCY